MRKTQQVEISPVEFEQQVKNWLDQASGGLSDFQSTHSAQVGGDSGEYEIDVLVTFKALCGAQIRILVECKRYKNPVKRDVVMLLNEKVRDVGAHKGIVFSTSGFQRGALEYADARGIATVTVQDGKTNYHTRAYGRDEVEPPPWVKLSQFIGWFFSQGSSGQTTFSLIDDERVIPLKEWMLK